MPRIAIIPLPSPCKPWQGEQKILYRSSPRSRSSIVRGRGNAFESLGTVNSSRTREPRGTVFSTKGRAERPSVKKSEGERGRFLGCCAMSCLRLHPVSKKTDASAQMRSATFDSEGLIIFHLADVCGFQLVEKTRRIGETEFWVARFNAQEKPVAGGVLDETFHVKERMMRARKSVQRQ